MKRYIRTEDRVYTTSELIKCEDKRFSNAWFTKNGAPLIAIKQADTIAALCDEFVEYGSRPIVITQANIKRARMLGKTPVILGAVWSNKGLIYVAKFNKKGELELL